MKSQFTLLLQVLVALLGIQHIGQAQESTFYEKALTDKKKIVVVRQPFEYQPPTEQEKADLKKISPNARFLTQEESQLASAFEYSVYLMETEDKTRTLLWQNKIAEFTRLGQRETPFKVYDVSFSADTLIFVYRTKGMVFAEVLPAPFPHSSRDYKWNCYVIKESNSTSPGGIDSAVIERSSPTQKPWSILLKSSLGGSYRFVWQNEKWVPQKTEQPQQLFVQPFTLDGKKWQLTYDIDPTATVTDTFEGGRTSTRNGTRATLSKATLAATTQAEAQAPEALRQSFTTFNPSASPQVWSGDVAVDEKTGKAYLAIADGSTFSLQIVSLRELNLRPPMPGMRDTRIQQQIEHQDVTIEADKTVVKELPLIDAISIKKVGDELTITLNSESKTQQQWIYSLATQTWQTATP